MKSYHIVFRPQLRVPLLPQMSIATASATRAEILLTLQTQKKHSSENTGLGKTSWDASRSRALSASASSVTVPLA